MPPAGIYGIMARAAKAIAKGELDCVVAMKALADPGRLRMLDALLNGPRSAGDLAEIAALTAYNASRHLNVLTRAGLLAKEKSGQRRLYRLSAACEVHLDRKRRVLSLGCCQFRLDALVAR